MEINKIEFLDISVELPVSIDVDLRTDIYSTERCKLIEQINFLKSVVKKLCVANGNTIAVKRSESVQYTDVMTERLEIGGIGFNTDTDFVNYPQPKGCEFQVFASTGLRVPRYH